MPGKNKGSIKSANEIEMINMSEVNKLVTENCNTAKNAIEACKEIIERIKKKYRFGEKELSEDENY